MINPYYAAISSPTINYKFYIDSYTFANQTPHNTSNYPLLSYAYTIAPTSPYLYVPKYIINPFYVGSSSIDISYCYLPLYKQITIQPDPTNPNLILPNPFYNPKINNPSAPIVQYYPFNTYYIPNPFDPNGGLIPNPYDFSGNSIMINPYYALVSSPTINYKFYIDSNTYIQQQLFNLPYNLSPLYPYLYLPPIIMNPFNINNQAILSSGTGSSIPYYPLFIQPTIQPDPKYHPNYILPNPFYNPKILDPLSSFSGPSYPFNTVYIPNPFDPTGAAIQNPYDFSGNTTTTNPYYSLLTTQFLSYKYYLDPYTYGYFLNECQNSIFIQSFGNLSTNIANYTPSPIYPYEYVPHTILNPFTESNTITTSYPYWPLFTTPFVVPDPMNPSNTLPNPFYNPKLLNPYATVVETLYPFNTPYIPNPFDPNGGVIPNPYDFSGNPTMVNPYYALVTAPKIFNNTYDNPGYNPVVNTDNSRGTISANILSVEIIENPAYNPNVIISTVDIPIDISNVNFIPNPAHNPNAIYDISNTLITKLGSVPNPEYNSQAIYDINNNDATVYESTPNKYTNSKAVYDISNQKLEQLKIVSNPYYNPNITNESSNPVNNWLGSSYSHHELRLKLNRMTVPIINSAYSKKPVPNVINQKIIVNFPVDYKIWLGENSAFMFNPQLSSYPLSTIFSESLINETKVSYNSVPTIQYKCVKPYYDISQNDYIAYVYPNFDSTNNIIPYNFSNYMNNINNSFKTMNTNSINLSNPNGIFRTGANPNYLNGTSSNTLFYKNSNSTHNVAADSKLSVNVDITKKFSNYDYYLDLGTGNLVKSLGLQDIQILTGYDASQNNIKTTIYLDASKNTYENSQYYGGYGIEISGNLWVAVGKGGGNTIVYSTNYGNTWNQGKTAVGSMSASEIFTERGNKVKYNGKIWVAAGKSGNVLAKSGNTLAYSSDGINWKGLGNKIFNIEANNINYSTNGNVWIAVGSGINCGNTIAYTDPSKDFVNSWSRIVNPFDVNGNGIANNVNWNSSFNCWFAVGTDGLAEGNTIVTSVNGNIWTAAPTNPFGPGGIGYSTACDGNTWVAVGSSPNTKTCIAYTKPNYRSLNLVGGNLVVGDLNWIPVDTDSLFKYGNPTTVSYNGNIWIVGGNGTNILATSFDGNIWTKELDTPNNAYNTFSEGINDIKWSSELQKWTMLGNCGFSENSIAISSTFIDNSQLIIPVNQPFSSGLTINNYYNINLNAIPTENTLTMYGSIPVNANGYKFVAGNFLTLIPNPKSANRFSGRELIVLTQIQADTFFAPNIASLTELVNAMFTSYQDTDGDYVLNNSNISFVTVGNTAYATLKIVINKYLTQYAYNMILNDPADISFNEALSNTSLQGPPTYLWKNPTNTWWKYLHIPYWNYPLGLNNSGNSLDANGNGFDTNGNYYVNHEIICKLVINKSISTITNMSYGTIRPNQLTIRKEVYTNPLTGENYPVNNKIVIQPQTVLPNPITSGDIMAGNPNANIDRIPGWYAVNPTKGLFTDNVSDINSDCYGYGYNTVVIIIPEGNYSSDELISYINVKLNSSPFIPVANQLTKSLLTYNKKCITFGTGFTTIPIPGVGTICELLFNINMIYDSRDYLLDFFDPYSFTLCNNVSNNVKNNTSWDSTLGWILGYRNYTEYPLYITQTNNVVSGNNILKLIASNIANNIFTVTDNQIQDTVDPSKQPYIITLQGDTAVSVNIYNYFLITLDDFNQNHLNDGLVTTSQSETDIPLPSYANRTLLKCDPTTQNLTISNINTNSSASDQSVTNIQRNLTQKQIYAAQEIVNTMQNTRTLSSISTPGLVLKSNVKYYSNGPFAQDVFAIVPLKLAGQQNNTVYVDYSGTLQNQERVYFGPVNIHRMTVSLVNDRGEIVDLNGANWTFSLICEQLYQQKKT